MDGILKIGGFVALGLIVCSTIFGFSLGLFFSVLMVVFASAAILYDTSYDTSKVMHHYSTQHYVAASLELFASVALLFWYILRIVMSLSRRKPVTKFLIVTDLDNTLVGNKDTLQRFNEQIEQHRIDYGSLLVYSTGRSLASYHTLRASENLLEPDALIVSVGTEIYFDGGDTPEADWSERLGCNWLRSQLLDTITQVTDLPLQPESDQGPFKISFSVTAEIATAVVPKIEAELHKKNLAAKVVYSAGKHLDIVPEQGDKGEAMQFLRQQWQMSAFRTAVCGDSGNDIALFKTGGERGILVGNAQPELLDWHGKNPVKHHYLAQEYCAAGILEGLRYFRFLP